MLNKLASVLGRPVIHILCGVLCLLLFSWPMLTGYAGDDPLSTFFNLFIIWGVFVVLLFVITRSSSSNDGDRTTDRPGGE